MSGLLRDAPVGQLIRWVTKCKILKYPEEIPGFDCPDIFKVGEKPASRDTALGAPWPDVDAERYLADPLQILARVATVEDTKSPLSGDPGASLERNLSKIVTRPEMSKVNTRKDLEQAYIDATQEQSLRRRPSQPITPTRLVDGTILVDWYSTDDVENPQNWSSMKKLLVVTQIYLYTFAVYMGSAIFVSSESYIIELWGISSTSASLGLALYVLGYGVGPLIFSPISEIPIIGRNLPYMATFAIFIILCVPTALVNNITGLLVLRFLQGFFGSPCLATGGASLGDLFNLLKLPYFLTFWACFAACGPALGPLISGFSVPAENWHWSLWEILWLSGPTFVLLMFCLPETSAPNILLRRAQRLRKLTGNHNLKSLSEIDMSKLTMNEIIIDSLWRPFQINALDPAVLFTSVYTALVYSIYYSFFEVFPLVYGSGNPDQPSTTHGYGFNLGEMGLVFLSISVGIFIAIPGYFLYLHYIFEPEILKSSVGAPERRLIPAIFASVLIPPSLFLFAWTGNTSPSIHWIVPTIGVAINSMGIFLILQCIFIYIPLSYPQYSASLFAGNDFLRSALATGAILFARPLFLNLGVGWGVTLLGGLTIGGIVGIWILYQFGAALRARSRFAVK